jgi:hypothetical protein
VERVSGGVGRGDAGRGHWDVSGVTLARFSGKAVVDIRRVHSRLSSAVVEDGWRGGQGELIAIQHRLFLQRNEE